MNILDQKFFSISFNTLGLQKVGVKHLCTLTCTVAYIDIYKIIRRKKACSLSKFFINETLNTENNSYLGWLIVDKVDSYYLYISFCLFSVPLSPINANHKEKIVKNDSYRRT